MLKKLRALFVKKTTYSSINGLCIDTCPSKKQNQAGIPRDGNTIGSVACMKCSHNLANNIIDKWVKCSQL